MSSDPMEKLDMPAVDSAGGKGAVVISQSVPVVAKPMVKEVHKLQADLARYREAVVMAVAAIEAQKRWNDEGWCRVCDDLVHALAVLKGLECGKGTQTSEVRLLMAMKEIKEGSEIKVSFVVKRLAKAGEKVGDTAIMSNAFRNLWWAVPVGKAGPEVLVCTDELDLESAS